MLREAPAPWTPRAAPAARMPREARHDEAGARLDRRAVAPLQDLHGLDPRDDARLDGRADQPAADSETDFRRPAGGPDGAVARFGGAPLLRDRIARLGPRHEPDLHARNDELPLRVGRADPRLRPSRASLGRVLSETPDG